MPVSRAAPSGWVQESGTGIARATPSGWLQEQSPTFTFDESIYPNAVTLVHLSGAYTDIDESPDTPDGSWLTVT